MIFCYISLDLPLFTGCFPIRGNAGGGDGGDGGGDGDGGNTGDGGNDDGSPPSTASPGRR